MKEVAARTERRVVQRRYLRPPGAIDEVAFLSVCTRCGQCGDVCPPKAIQKAPPSAGFAAGTPIIEPLAQPCTVCDDMPCVAACPTGALVPPEHGWDGYALGTLELVPETCITFNNVTCDVCVRRCPVGERAIATDAGGHPVIRAEGCVGCGVCVRACVTSPPSLKLHPKEER